MRNYIIQINKNDQHIVGQESIGSPGFLAGTTDVIVCASQLQAQQIVNMLKTAYHAGRQDKAHEIRNVMQSG